MQRSATETLRETKFSQALRFADPGAGQEQTTELDASVGTSLTYVHDGQRGESSTGGQSSQEEAGGGGGCGKRRRARLRETRRATLNSDTGEAGSENAFETPLSPA